MNRLPIIDVFAEDHAHEAFLRALLNRLEHEKGKRFQVRFRSARGGHGRVLSELKLFQRSVLKLDVETARLPDLLVVAIDANCRRLNLAYQEIENTIDEQFKTCTVIACPDPHIEKWYLADAPSFCHVVGRQPQTVRMKCERDRYKSLLAETIRAAGHPTILGGVEFAEDIVNAMDLFRAGQKDPSLNRFIRDLRSFINRI